MGRCYRLTILGRQKKECRMPNEIRIVSESTDIPIMTTPTVIYRPETIKGKRYTVTPEPPQPRDK